MGRGQCTVIHRDQKINLICPWQSDIDLPGVEVYVLDVKQSMAFISDLKNQ